MKVFKVFLVPIFFFLLSFYLPRDTAYASNVDWKKVDFVEVENINKEDNVVLFLGDDCKACSALYTSIKELNLEEYFSIQLVDGHEAKAKEKMKEFLREKDFETEPLVIPVLVHEDFVTLGYSSVSAYIQALHRLRGSDEWNSTVAKVAQQILEEEKIDRESKPIYEIIAAFDWWIYILFALILILFAFAVYLFIKKRQILSPKGKFIFVFGEVLFLALTTIFLVLTIQSEKKYIPEDTLAGCVSGVGCDTWAELVAWRAQNADTSTSEGRKAVRTANATFGENEWKDVQVGSAIGDSKSSENQVLRTAYDQVVAGLEQKARADKLAGKSVNSLDDCGSDVDCQRAFAAYQSVASPAKYLEIQLKEILGDNYKDLVQEGGALSGKCRDSNGVLLTGSGLDNCILSNANYIPVQDAEGKEIYLTADKNTGTVIANPVGISYVEDFCELTGLGTGNGSTTGAYACRCDNGNGGYVYTRTDATWVSCDSVCLARKLVCDDCNPPAPPPPRIIITSDPYCGDGILGNTSGEQCEYGDPSGVSCSWNTCNPNTCVCPSETEPYCGDGKLDSGELCELNNPTGVTCNWDSCNQVNCKCVEPGCGDGKLDEGESCERNDPAGVSCLWETECNQLKCGCNIPQSEFCGDGILQEGEQCEVNNPLGKRCDWDQCSNYSCLCPTVVNPTLVNPSNGSPNTGILNSYNGKILLGSILLVLGLFYDKLTHLYQKLSSGIIGQRKKTLENNFK